MAAVAIQNVSKSFGAVNVLKDLSITIENGEFLVLVGPSGCGKSTLLRMIAGLETISNGTIKIGEQIVNDLPPKQRDISMVFQNYALYPHLTVAQNMGFSLMLANAPKEEQTERVQYVAGILGLTDLLERKPKQLSGGQRQRVAMGRAIVRNPKVFLFDEPLSNLDAKLRIAMRTEIKSLHHRLKTTSVYVTHDQVEAMTMADRIIVMNAGQIEQVGQPLELYDDPDNIFVAGFIGTPAMNFIDATVEEQNGHKLAVFKDGSTLQLPSLKKLRNGQDVICGIRPENMELASAGAASIVQVVEPMGAETHVITEFSGVSVVVAARERLRLKLGDQVYLSAHPDKIMLFDRLSGQRIR